ncbi:MAG TPA: hypothetical protein VN950_03335 [Terriglobales bacterium]|nr:hypothetical protein [Terriglobales bacterium]
MGNTKSVAIITGASQGLPAIQEPSSALTSLEAGLQAPPAHTGGVIR